MQWHTYYLQTGRDRYAFVATVEQRRTPREDKQRDQRVPAKYADWYSGYYDNGDPMPDPLKPWHKPHRDGHRADADACYPYQRRGRRSVFKRVRHNRHQPTKHGYYPRGYRY